MTPLIAAGPVAGTPLLTGSSSRVTRRGALRQLAWLAAAAGLPVTRGAESGPDLPHLGLLQSDPERFWSQLRSEHFLLPENRVFLNNGSLGVVPKSVLQTIIATTTRAAEYSTDNIVRWGYETLESDRAEMAEFLGCTKEELAFTHNCTEAMSIIANGLDLKAGDEVILTDQEHGGGSSGWKLRAARAGIIVREVAIPTSPKTPADLITPLLAAISSRTRVLSFSGITSPTGLILPTRELCRAARDRGVLSVVDGAHMDGQIPVHLQELECDYFAGSPHKWLFAPAGCGLLYGRGSALEHLWPCVATSGWDNTQDLHAARFMMMGTNNRAPFDGMMEGLRFFKRIGSERIYERTHQLARMVVEHVKRRDYLELVTPDDDQFYHAMVSFRCHSPHLDKLGPALQQVNVCAIAGERFRISTHVHTRPSDIETLFRVCDQVLTG